MTEIYPSIENPNFNYMIAKHADFKNFKSSFEDYTMKEIIKLTEDRCNSAGGFIYKNIQLFVSSFISLNTPYNGLLLYHGVGVGKTCSSLLISNNFKEYVKKNNKKIIILTKPAIQEGFRNEIFDYKKHIDNVEQNLLTCVSNEYKSEWEKWKELYPEDKYEEFRNTIISEYYEIYGYQEFTNKYKYLKKKGIYNREEINNIFSNCIIIIDEVHNLRDEQSDDLEDNSTKKINTKESKEFLNAIFENLTEPIKLILLSATPMYDKFDEIEFLINILKKNDKNPDLINTKLLNDIITETDANKLRKLEETFYSYVKGYVSYIKGNDPFIFPKILFPKEHVDIYFNQQETFMPVVKCIMNKYQKSIYQECKEKQKLQYSNLVLPSNDSNILLNFDELFTYKSKTDSFTNINQEKILDLFDNLDKYSCKLNKLKNILKQNTVGKIFIYSSFIKPSFGGGKFISLLLETLGFQRKIVKKNKLIISNTLEKPLTNTPNNQYYIRLDGETSDKDRKTYIDSFNSNDNIYGENIKIIIGSTNLFEGVSLFNVREIHILEPWYNKSRYEQIIGRGYRQCSHKLLPFNQRNITIYNYVAISNELENNRINDKGLPMNDIDLRKIQLSNQKMDSINKLDKLLKKSSVDCLLNKNINNLNLTVEEKTSELNDTDLNVIEQVNSKNENLIIRMENDIDTCFNEEHSNPKEYDDIIKIQDDIDRINIFTNPNYIANIKYFIKIVIIESNSNYFNIDDLYNKTLKKYANIDLNIFKIALQELILTKEPIFNKFNIKGFITINGSYIIFKPFNISHIKDIPIEFIQYPFKTKLSNIKIYDNYPINLQLINYKNTDTDTSKTSKKSSKKKKEPTKSIETNISSNTTQQNQYENILSILLDGCNTSSILENLSEPEIFKKYNTLWSSLSKDKGKNHPNFNTDFNNDVLTNHMNEKKVSLLKQTLFNNLFYKPFKSPEKLYNDYNINISENTISNMYKINLYLMLIFNYLPIIVTYLKCIFYKKHISKSDLSDFETSIYNYYEKYIVNEDPLIFKFVDFSKDNLDAYNYEYLQNIYYEYDIEEEKWNLHHMDVSKVPTAFKDIKSIQCTFYKFKSSNNSKLIKPDFVIRELKIEQADFDFIYKSFDYNKYSDTNDGYYYYSGDIDNPKETILSKISNRSPKISNIIGCSTTFTTDTKKNLNSKLSRIIINLSVIWSKRIKTVGKNVYFKNSFDSGAFKTHLPNINEYEQVLHIIYCVIDQVYELNHKIILSNIINNDDILEQIWASDEKYEYKTLYSYRFDNEDKFQLEFTETQFNDLKSLLNNTYKLNITDTYDNIKKQIEKDSKLFNYIPYETILEYFTNIHKNDPSNDLNNARKEHYYTKLLSILLYDLDSKKFEKRWLLNYYETCILNSKVLDINIKPNTKYKECKQKCGDTTSLTNESVFSLSKKLDGRRSKSLINLDT